MSSSHLPALAYDAIAPIYDAQLAQNPVAQYMRERLHGHLSRTYKPGETVLDFTAGTGVDACFLASRGVQVIALDISPAMIAEAERAAARAGVRVETHVLAAERLRELELGELDGAISTFGGLNAIQNLPRLAEDLAACLRPGAPVILHALNRFFFWEWAHGRGQARRNPRYIEIGGTGVLHRFYTPSELQALFAPHFDVRSVYGLSVVAAPGLVRRWPVSRTALFALDRVAGRLFPAAGDFLVMELSKRDGQDRS